MKYEEAAKKNPDFCFCKAQHWEGNGCIAPNKPYPGRYCSEYFLAIELKKSKNTSNSN